MPIECFLKLNLQFRPRSRVILKEIKYKTCIQHISVHPRLDLVNMVVRPFLFTELSLFTKSSLDKE